MSNDLVRVSRLDEKKEMGEKSLMHKGCNITDASLDGGTDNVNTNGKLENTLKDLDIVEQEDIGEVKVEEPPLLVDPTLVDENPPDFINDVNKYSVDSTDPEYPPKKVITLSIIPDCVLKGVRGRSHTMPTKREEKSEEYMIEYIKFPCSACQDMFDTVHSLDKHINFKHKGLKCEETDVNLRKYVTNIKLNEIKPEMKHLDFVDPVNVLNNISNGEFSGKSKIEESSVATIIPKIEMNDNQMLVTSDGCAQTFTIIEGVHYHKHDKEHTKLLTTEKLKSNIDHFDKNEYLESQVMKKLEVEEMKYKENNTTNTLLGGGNDNGNTDSGLEKVLKGLENIKQEDIEEVEVEEHKVSVDSILINDNPQYTINNVEEDFVDSIDPEYFPQRLIASKIKRGRGRPRKNPDSLLKPKIKIPGKGRGRPPTMMVKKEAYVHKCNVCNKEFKRVGDLKRHATSHSSDKRFLCTACPMRFSRCDTLKKHQNMHDRNYNLQCEICHKAYNRANLLTMHKASKHGIGEKVKREKKYDCPLCGNSFTTKRYRDVHVDGHGRQYPCKVCQETFLSKSYLTIHLKSHAEHDKKFLCSVCGQQFSRKDYLIIHMRRHSGEKPFKCRYCRKGFTRTPDLVSHEKCHTGEKPHSCKTCGKGFRRLYSLKLHVRTHTGEKPYQCKHCDAGFIQRVQLKSHVRRRHFCDLVQVNLDKKLNN